MSKPHPDIELVQLHIRIPVYLKEFVQEWAQLEGTSMTNLILRYVREKWEKENLRKGHDVESI